MSPTNAGRGTVRSGSARNGAGPAGRPPGAGHLEGGIYLVTDAALCAVRGVARVARAAVEAGVRTVQVRHKPADGGEVLRVALEVARAVGNRATVIVNDRVDVFLAARALGAPVHGVHVGQEDLPAAVVREMIGPGAILGISASTPGELAELAELPAGTLDYVGVGTVRSTDVKPDAPPPLGVPGIGTIARECGLPCVAIGGIGVGDIASLRHEGLHAAAVVSAICASEDPGAAARRLVAEWDGAAEKPNASEKIERLHP